jgi:hypothetical protein
MYLFLQKRIYGACACEYIYLFFNYSSLDLRTQALVKLKLYCSVAFNCLPRPLMTRSLDDTEAVHAFINEQTADHMKAASQYQINQHAQNLLLQKASDVNMKMAALQKQSKSEKLDVLITLWIYPAMGAAAKKVFTHYALLLES